MIKKTFVIVGISAAAALLTGACFFASPSDTRNLSPVIVGFETNNERIEDSLDINEGLEKKVLALVYDPNGDNLNPEFFSWSCSDGTVIGEGVSVTIRAPAGIEWGIPAEPLEITCTVCVTDDRSDPVCEDLTVMVEPPCPADNLPPIIHSITADPVEVDLGQTVTITVDAEDPEGKPLTYIYEPDFGYMEGEGAVSTWVTTDTCCDDWYPVAVKVSDGCDQSFDYVDVRVIP